MSTQNQFLARSKSNGTEKRAPPPVKPKPSALTSSAIDPTSTTASPSSSTFPRTTVTVTDNDLPTSSSFGDLKKAFERQQNSAPLFLSQSSSGGNTSAGYPSHASVSRVQQQSSSLGVPSFGSNSRPRSASSPAPPHRESGGTSASRTGAAASSSTASLAPGEGIDQSQPDFGNLRARFQSQAALSNTSVLKPDPPRPKPKQAFNASKPVTVITSPSPPPIVQAPRMSLDSSRSAAIASRFTSPHSAPSLASISSSSRLSSNSLKQPPRPPPEAPSKPTFGIKTPTPAPTPPRIPTPQRAESPESERNPFMGSDEDEPSSPVTTAAPISIIGRTPSAPIRPISKIQQNPVFQQLNNNFAARGPQRPLAAVPGRDSVLVGKMAPPPPQRAAPRPDSPQGRPPKLPSRSNSITLTAVEDTPEEKERKHRLDKRRRVVQELLETEISYSKDMLLLQEVYVTDMMESHLFTAADEKIIFTNLADVIALTLDFVALLTPACGGSTNGQYDDSATFVGEAFLQMMSRIRRVYSEYCKRQEASAQHLQELDSRKELKPFFEACTEKCKGKTTGWDLASLLIKPVQRVLKYPLLINQIHALTPPDHTDFENLVTVHKDMLQVAEEINEIKKRKDIVEKIVGSKKKNDSDIVHGFNKKFARTTQQLRQAVGGSDVTVDILFEALLEKFNLQQRLVREFAKYIQAWLLSIKQFFDTQEALASTLVEIYGMAPVHRHDEHHSITVVQEFHRNMTQFSKSIGRELEGRLKKTVYKSMESFLKLFSGPLQVMKKREKKLLDYDNVRGMKERGDTIDKNMLESAAAYTAINEQLVDELPVFLGLTTQYFDLIVMEFSKVQMYFYEQVKAKILDYYAEFMDPTASRDLIAYLAQMNLCEDYIEMMQRHDGPIERMERITLIRNVASTHEMAFRDIRETAQRRRRSTSATLPSRSRSSSTASPLPEQTPVSGQPSWHSKSGSQLLASPTEMVSIQEPIVPRYYEADNPFEMPESIFSDDYETNSNSGSGSGSSRSRNIFGSGSAARPLSTASSSYSFSSAASMDYSQPVQQSEKPPALDEGMDMDEIGIAQALFECTAIYPYSSTEDRQLNFEAGESIVVFGLNEDGWYFGKKVENRLCRLIVREHFGPIVEKVANVLIRKGRMPAGMIAHLTQIKLRQVRDCLLVMIQHNFVVYAEAQEKTRIVTYYEINRAELLHRTMIPKVLGYAKEWFGNDGLKIAQSMAAHGKQTILDCLADIMAKEEMRLNKDQRTLAIKRAFTNMVKENILVAVRPSDSLTAADKEMAEEKREMDKMTLPPTATELANIRKALGAQRAMVDQRNDIIGLKRTMNEAGYDDLSFEKRRKTDAQDLTIVEEVETDVYFKINFERFTIRWRNKHIADLYEDRLNRTAVTIMDGMLTLAEKKMVNCKEERSTAVSSMQLYRQLPEDLNVAETLEFEAGEIVHPRTDDRAGKARFFNECLDKYMEVIEGDLMQIMKRDDGRSGQYVVELRRAAKIMKRKLIQDVVMTRYGAPYVRIMNLLMDKGKLEEKQISKFSMLPVKNVREKLTTLHTFGVLSLQEVPKTADRTPSRTFYLWEVILDRAVDSMTEKLYQTMANLRQRRFAERMKRQVLLDKCERTDVKENKGLLNDAERKELDSLNSILELLEIQEMRVGEMVITLRDY
ncbi:hypothetical protein BGX28_010515 [Mortierella sp. GBA30]|nr:hypothetical protein BGX28_010515 [Mortierella sp. GBA30]